MINKEEIPDDLKDKRIDPQIIFIENHLPPLKAGEYALSIEQHVHNTDKTIVNETFNKVHNFGIRGDRFSIGAKEIHSVFPPKDSQGDFLNNLPHIVFRRKILPWERSIHSTDSPTDTSTWMALLLFNDDDPPPTAQQLTAADLLAENLPANTLSYPELEPLDYGEKETDPCSIIDIPLELFNQIAPSLDEITYLTHARKVSTKNKIDKLAALDLLDFSVVVGNRLPGKGKNVTVHLVSLEGFANYLPDENGNQSQQIPSSVQTIRLISLYSWNFYSQDIPQSFKDILQNVNADPLNPILPIEADTETTLDANVTTAFKQGYTAINHQTRGGNKTVSWYRSAFTPYEVTDILNFPVDSSDALMRYNPDTGMFDVSYAAAWMLGRQLALQNKLFSVALYNWKQAQKQKNLMSVTHSHLATQFSAVLDNDIDLQDPHILLKETMNFLKTNLTKIGDKPYDA